MGRTEFGSGGPGDCDSEFEEQGPSARPCSRARSSAPTAESLRLERRIERFQAKHAPGLDPGVYTGSREENATKQKLERNRDSFRWDCAPPEVPADLARPPYAH